MKDNKFKALICGICLIGLNLEIVYAMINSFFALFYPVGTNMLDVTLLKYVHKGITVLSFIGVIITIFCVLSILKDIILKKS